MTRTMLEKSRGVISICVTYFYFLIFAQFGFLGQVAARLDQSMLEPVMAGMGLAGLASAFLTMQLLKYQNAMGLLRLSLLGCWITAMGAIAAQLPGHFVIVAVAIGLALGCLTVTLATDLIRLTGTRRLGLQVGLGTGLAYFACNVPIIFEANPNYQAAMAGVACLLGLAVNLSDPKPDDGIQSTPQKPSVVSRYKRVGFILVVFSFLALIWMDSAVFYIIQQNTQLKQVTWDSGHLWGNAVTHLVFAVIAGLIIDRGGFQILLSGAYLLLAGGALILSFGNSWGLPAVPFYVAGVSLYSVPLVAYPSLWREAAGLVPKRARAGIIYGIAGWIGSAMGIGMARDLNRIPLLFLLAAGMVMMTAWLLTKYGLSRALKGTLAISGLVLLVGCQAFSEPEQAPDEGPSAIKGRSVYINEGCINCHSQYVRPGTSDENRWGPYRQVDSKEDSPPLYGNRRQGPDLMNVGNRRSADWQKLHLMNPRLVSPGSMMPAYNHLFHDRRGDDLIAYLQSLGAYTIPERLTFTRSWSPANQNTISVGEAAHLFKQSCAACHGDQGRGDGQAAAFLKLPARDLVGGQFRFMDPYQEDAAVQLARIIKFGIIGTDMPGHEYLRDDQVMGLVQYVQVMRVRGGMDPQ